MKTKLKLILLVLTVAFYTSCQEESVEGNMLNFDLLSKSMMQSENNIRHDTIIAISDTVVEVKNEIPMKREDLENMKTIVKIYSGNDHAGITVPGFGGIKLGKNESNLNVYYLETKIVTNENDSIVYGIGYSVHYLFKKVKRGLDLDLANLPSIAASVQLENNRTQVYYSLQTYGIISVNLAKYFKPTVNKIFDVEGFGVIQSSIDGIHNILGDTLLSESVKFTPQILKFVQAFEVE